MLNPEGQRLFLHGTRAINAYTDRTVFVPYIYFKWCSDILLMWKSTYYFCRNSLKLLCANTLIKCRLQITKCTLLFRNASHISMNSHSFMTFKVIWGKFNFMCHTFQILIIFISVWKKWGLKPLVKKRWHQFSAIQCWFGDSTKLKLSIGLDLPISRNRSVWEKWDLLRRRRCKQYLI